MHRQKALLGCPPAAPTTSADLRRNGRFVTVETMLELVSDDLQHRSMALDTAQFNCHTFQQGPEKKGVRGLGSFGEEQVSFIY